MIHYLLGKGGYLLGSVGLSVCEQHYSKYCSDMYPEQSVWVIIDYLCTFYYLKPAIFPCTSCIVHVHVLCQIVNEECYTGNHNIPL